MPTTKPQKPVAKKWLLIGSSILGLSILLVIGLAILNFWLPRKLQDMVHQQSKGVYNLELYNLRASPLTGALSVDSLLLTADRNKWKQLNADSVDAPRMLMYMKSGKTEITGLSYWNVITGKAIEMTDLSVTAPDLKVEKVREDTTSVHEPMHVSAKGMLQGLKINKITIRQAHASYSSQPDSKSELVAVKDFDLTVHAFQLDSASFHATDRAYYARAITFNAKEIDTRTIDGFYKIVAGPVKLNTNKGTVTALNINVEPLLQPREMAVRNGAAITYVKSKLGSVQLSGIQFAEHSRSNQVYINQILLRQPSISLYKDKKNFKDKGIKPLPHDMVQDVKTAFYIDTVRVQGMYIRYDELAEKATEPGHLFISNLNGSIGNLTNMPDRISDKNPAVVRLRGKFMGEASVKATLKMPLLNKNGYHTLEAEAGTANPNLLNTILEPTNLMSIKSGKLQQGSAKMVLNRHSATGSMRIIYQDFKVDLISDSRGNEQSLGKKILSKAANSLVIKSENPGDKGEAPRIGKISVTRDSSRSVFTYWKDGLASGFLSSIGLDMISEK